MLAALELLPVCTFTGAIRMVVDCPFTISNFYKFINEKQLMAAKCNDCQTIILPPKPMCTNCFSDNLEWISIKGKGKLLSYTIIHVAPEQFQSMVPYIVGIVNLEAGVSLPGIIRKIPTEKIKIGMNLKIDFDLSPSTEWPEWSRYFFRSC